jgi:hypothetical protein
MFSKLQGSGYRLIQVNAKKFNVKLQVVQRSLLGMCYQILASSLFDISLHQAINIYS